MEEEDAAAVDCSLPPSVTVRTASLSPYLPSSGWLHDCALKYRSFRW